METMANEWIQEGILKGILKGQSDMVLRILQRRFQVSEERLQSLQQQHSQIEDGETLSQLADLSFDVLVLPDFVAKLQMFLTQPFASQGREGEFIATPNDRAG